VQLLWGAAVFAGWNASLVKLPRIPQINWQMPRSCVCLGLECLVCITAYNKQTHTHTQCVHQTMCAWHWYLSNQDCSAVVLLHHQLTPPASAANTHLSAFLFLLINSTFNIHIHMCEYNMYVIKQCQQVVNTQPCQHQSNAIGQCIRPTQSCLYISKHAKENYAVFYILAKCEAKM